MDMILSSVSEASAHLSTPNSGSEIHQTISWSVKNKKTLLQQLNAKVKRHKIREEKT